MGLKVHSSLTRVASAPVVPAREVPTMQSLLLVTDLGSSRSAIPGDLAGVKVATSGSVILLLALVEISTCLSALQSGRNFPLLWRSKILSFFMTFSVHIFFFAAYFFLELSPRGAILLLA